MRILSKEEQDICLRILKGSGHNNFLANIIDHKLHGVCIDITKETKVVFLEFTVRDFNLTSEETEKMIDRMTEISFFILTTVNLIALLEKEGYIMTIKRETQISTHSKFGGCIGNHPSATNYFTDDIISDLLIKYCDKEIIATEEFRRFCERNFLARDEQRFRRQSFISILALTVATTALVLNTCFNLLPKFTGGTKIKQEQIDTLSGGLFLIQSKLDTVIKNNREFKKTAIDSIIKQEFILVDSLQRPKPN